MRNSNVPDDAINNISVNRAYIMHANYCRSRVCASLLINRWKRYFRSPPAPEGLESIKEMPPPFKRVELLSNEQRPANQTVNFIECNEQHTGMCTGLVEMIMLCNKQFRIFRA